MSGLLEVMTKEQVDSIHESSLDILERVGVKFWDDGAIEALTVAGAIADGAVVKFPRDMVTDALRKAPRTILLAGRDRRHDITLGDGPTRFGTLGTAPLMYDMDTGERRYAKKKDLEDFAHLAEGLESVRYFHTSVTPMDMPTETVDLRRWAIALSNTTKHCMGAAVYSTANMPYLIRMLETVSGGEDETRRRPLVTATECPVSPLQHDRRPLCGIMEFARRNLPVIIYSEPKAGATAPASLAGTLVVSNCEVLSGITLMQVINPGAPVIYGSVATLMDMRTGSIAFGSPETGLLAACTTQMARSYGIPNMTPGGRTDSKMPDEQAGYEKMRTALMAALSGASLGNMAGLLESNLVASFEQMVIDDEIIGTIERVSKGIDFDTDALALELIESVKPGGTYISRRHTMDRLRKEHYMPRVSDRRYYATWASEGKRTMVDDARERARRIMKDHVPCPAGHEDEVEAVIAEAQKAAAKRS
jgi:trimethylamine--corrinoid protein Co-methyltransferase